MICSRGNMVLNDVCDVYIINTCTVTSTSDAKVEKLLDTIRRNPKAIIW